MNENMRFSTFNHLNDFPNFLGLDLQNSANSSETSSTELNGVDNEDVSLTSSKSNDLSDMVNHLSYIDSHTSELISVEKVNNLENFQIGPLLYKPNTDIKHKIFTINNRKIDFNFDKIPLKNAHPDDSISEGNDISKFAIDSVTIYRKTNENASAVKSATTLSASENSSIKNTTPIEFFRNKEKLSPESGYKNKIETIKMYRDTLLKTKDTSLMFDFAVFLLKSGLEIYEDNEKVSKKIIKEGCYYLKKMAMKGNEEAQYLLGDVYSNDTMKCINLKQSRILFETAAKKGHTKSAYRAALCYEKGIGVSRDSRKALLFLKLAASKNHTKSMHKLGMFYFKGQMGVQKSVVTQQNGINWLSRAVAKNDSDSAEAAYELGKIYETGFMDIVISDINYAVSLYVHASSLGHTKSNTKLGQIYEKADSKSIKQNKMLSIHYYTIASNSTDPDPNSQLKLSFFNLLGVENLMEPDLESAFSWAKKAAELENPDAEFTLGYYYEKGIGCKRNMGRANECFKLALKHGNLKALKKVKYDDSAIVKSDSMASLVSTIYSDKNSARDFSLKRDRIKGFLKRKKLVPEEDPEDINKCSIESPHSHTTDNYSTALPYNETPIIPKLAKTIENQNEKTFFHSTRLRRLFKPI